MPNNGALVDALLQQPVILPAFSCQRACPIACSCELSYRYR
ncbi:hypothetical protein HDE78_000185 [Rhodanobacter sp. K2T2]|nr:hypothetical protein [Rhodanobacter sp. K2T2]NYE27260.1 hypothetical protein [Rhodanobacter sp. K2T2]